jgi:hypothetical protein
MSDRLSRLLLAPRVFRARLGPWLQARRHAGAYRVLTEEELRETRKSDTLFVFGSGRSLQELTPAEIRTFEDHDTLGFNWFVQQDFVRCDYHLIREITSDDLDPALWQDQVRRYFTAIRENPGFVSTVYLVQSGFRAINGNRALGMRLLPEHSRVFRWRSLTRRETLSRSLAEGLAHNHATLEECVNFGYLLGWRRIVLVGVDLYDRRYFWPGEHHPLETAATVAEPHAQSDNGHVQQLAAWGATLAGEGIALEVYNPRSLLAGPLPVYPVEDRAPGSSGA